MILNKLKLKMNNIITFVMILFVIFNLSQVSFAHINFVDKAVTKSDSNKYEKFIYNKPNNKNSGINIVNSKSLLLNSKVESDTSKSLNKITRVWSNGEDRFVVRVELASGYNGEIQLSVFNILGKEVIDIYKGQVSSNPTNTYEYEFMSSNLPNGIYLCILNGRNFRDAEKFIVSR